MLTKLAIRQRRRKFLMRTAAEARQIRTGQLLITTRSRPFQLIQAPPIHQTAARRRRHRTLPGRRHLLQHRPLRRGHLSQAADLRDRPPRQLHRHSLHRIPPLVRRNPLPRSRRVSHRRGVRNGSASILRLPGDRTGERPTRPALERHPIHRRARTASL